MSDFISEAGDEFNQTAYIQTQASDGDAVVGYIFVFYFFPNNNKNITTQLSNGFLLPSFPLSRLFMALLTTSPMHDLPTHQGTRLK